MNRRFLKPRAMRTLFLAGHGCGDITTNPSCPPPPNESADLDSPMAAMEYPPPKKSNFLMEPPSG